MNCTKVLNQPFQFCGAGNRNNPGFLCQQPAQCNLGGGDLLPGSKLYDKINQGLVCFSVVR